MAPPSPSTMLGPLRRRSRTATVCFAVSAVLASGAMAAGLPSAAAGTAEAATAETATAGIGPPAAALGTRSMPLYQSGLLIIRKAASLRGRPYRWGGVGPRAFDCSGYTRYVYRTSIHKWLPRTSRAQYASARRISRATARPGDLAFLHGRTGVYHVGIYAGSNQYWHAPRPGRGVTKERIWTRQVTFGRRR